MTTTHTAARATTLGDRGASYLRTIVPVLWGSALTQAMTWAAPLLPGDVGHDLSTTLSDDAVTTAATATVIGAWYILWRLVEPHLPPWATRLALGSAAAPTYTHTNPPADDNLTPPAQTPPDPDDQEHDYDTVETHRDGTLQLHPATEP